MELKDTELVRRGIGVYPLYGYFYENSPVTLQPAGKIERFMGDKSNVGEERMMMPVVYREVARTLAEILPGIPNSPCENGRERRQDVR